MEEIVHAFGIDWRLIIIQMFNFALLMAALWYFLYTPILKILEMREAKIRQGVLDAESAHTALTEADREKQVILKEARIEAESIVDQAKSHAETKSGEMIAAAERKAERVMSEATARGEEERTRIRKESEADIAKAAMFVAEEILKKG